MMELYEREKVLQGLKCCQDGLCNLCPYYNYKDGTINCHNKTWFNDALTLLKSSKSPHVLTLDELFTLEKDTPVYIEGNKYLYGWDIFSNIDNETGDIIMGTLWRKYAWSRLGYGDTWRCWTSKPTKKQMEREKWRR